MCANPESTSDKNWNTSEPYTWIHQVKRCLNSCYSYQFGTKVVAEIREQFLYLSTHNRRLMYCSFTNSGVLLCWILPIFLVIAGDEFKDTEAVSPTS